MAGSAELELRHKIVEEINSSLKEPMYSHKLLYGTVSPLGEKITSAILAPEGAAYRIANYADVTTIATNFQQAIGCLRYLVDLEKAIRTPVLSTTSNIDAIKAKVNSYFTADGKSAPTSVKPQLIDFYQQFMPDFLRVFEDRCKLFIKNNPQHPQIKKINDFVIIALPSIRNRQPQEQASKLREQGAKLDSIMLQPTRYSTAPPISTELTQAHHANMQANIRATLQRLTASGFIKPSLQFQLETTLESLGELYAMYKAALRKYKGYNELILLNRKVINLCANPGVGDEAEVQGARGRAIRRIDFLLSDEITYKIGEYKRQLKEFEDSVKAGKPPDTVTRKKSNVKYNLEGAASGAKSSKKTSSIVEPGPGGRSLDEISVKRRASKTLKSREQAAAAQTPIDPYHYIKDRGEILDRSDPLYFSNLQKLKNFFIKFSSWTEVPRAEDWIPADKNTVIETFIFKYAKEFYTQCYRILPARFQSDVGHLRYDPDNPSKTDWLKDFKPTDYHGLVEILLVASNCFPEYAAKYPELNAFYEVLAEQAWFNDWFNGYKGRPGFKDRFMDVMGKNDITMPELFAVLRSIVEANGEEVTRSDEEASAATEDDDTAGDSDPSGYVWDQLQRLLGPKTSALAEDQADSPAQHAMPAQPPPARDSGANTPATTPRRSFALGPRDPYAGDDEPPPAAADARPPPPMLVRQGRVMLDSKSVNTSEKGLTGLRSAQGASAPSPAPKGARPPPNPLEPPRTPTSRKKPGNSFLS